MNKRNGSILMAGGLLLIAAALSLTCHNIWEERQAEASASAALLQIRPELPGNEPVPGLSEDIQEAVIPDYLLNPEMEMPTEEIDGQEYIGVLTIPVLELELPVISKWSYSRLKIAPCRFEGSAYLNDLIIAAHNYKSHFGRLKNLLPGDAVTFTDADGHVFSYTVAETETLGKNDLEELRNGVWDLTLITCTIGGKMRVAVRCKRLPAGDSGTDRAGKQQGRSPAQLCRMQERLTYIDGTCVEMLTLRAVRRNNTSGVPGVCWYARKERRQAAICFQGGLL